MAIMVITGGFGHPVSGTPVSGIVGCYAWRVRPTQGAVAVLGGLLATDTPEPKHPRVSALERCP